MKKYLYFLLLAFAISGCMEMEDREIYLDHPLIGSWEILVNSEEGMELVKVPALGADKRGYIFKSNGEMVERQNSSWCGTPPVMLADYMGSWKREDPGVRIQGKYWGGTYLAQWELLRLSESEVLVKVLHSDYQ